jgi:MarR family transcriptional regulator for hemolysin
MTMIDFKNDCRAGKVDAKNNCIVSYVGFPFLDIVPLGDLVHDVSRMCNIIVDRRLKLLGLTRAQWFLLFALSKQEEYGGDNTASSLSKSLSLDRAVISSILGRLESRGFIYRANLDNDRRIKQILISSSGNAALERGLKPMMSLSDTILEGLSIDECKNMEQYLTILLENIISITSNATV